MLTVVSQATPPLPGQAPDTKAHIPKRSGEKTTISQKPAATVPAIPIVSEPVTDVATHNQTNKDQSGTDNKTVVVTKLPAVSIERDWIDYWTFGIAICLAGIGIGGVWYARKTLKVIKGQLTEIQSASTQTDAMIRHASTQADAAKRSADFLVNGERAWIIVRPDQNSRLVPTTLGMASPYNMFHFTMTNRGKTVARLMSFQSGGFLAAKGQTLDEVPTYEPQERTTFGTGNSPNTQEISYTGVFAPEEPNPMRVAIGVILTADQIERMGPGGDLAFYVFGRIRYFDLAEKERVVQFCYRYMGETENFDGQIVRWMLDGPPAYNTHT